MSSMIYATTIVLRHPEPGEFARVLMPAPCGTRYEDRKPERSSSTKAARWTPQPLVPNDKPALKPRWTQERIDALPKTSGYLTLVGHSEPGAGVMMVSLRCAGPSPKCQGTMVKPASTYAKDTSRPRACWSCSMYGRKRYNAPITPKGYERAREHAAKLKTQLSERKVAVR